MIYRVVRCYIYTFWINLSSHYIYKFFRFVLIWFWSQVGLLFLVLLAILLLPAILMISPLSPICKEPSVLPCCGLSASHRRSERPSFFVVDSCCAFCSLNEINVAMLRQSPCRKRGGQAGRQHMHGIMQAMED